MAVAGARTREDEGAETTESWGPPGSEARRGRERAAGPQAGHAREKGVGPKRFVPKPRLRFKNIFYFRKY